MGVEVDCYNVNVALELESSVLLSLSTHTRPKFGKEGRLEVCFSSSRKLTHSFFVSSFKYILHGPLGDVFVGLASPPLLLSMYSEITK